MFKKNINNESKKQQIKNNIVKNYDICEKITWENIIFKIIIQAEFYDASLHGASTKLDM